MAPEDNILALRAALREAIREIDAHNSDCDHITPEGKLVKWKKLLE